MTHLPIAPGTSLHFSIGDFDGDDEYTFTVVESAPSLRLRWSGAGDPEQ